MCNFYVFKVSSRRKGASFSICPLSCWQECSYSVWGSLSNLGACGVLCVLRMGEQKNGPRWPHRASPPALDCLPTVTQPPVSKQHNDYLELSQWTLLKVNEAISGFSLSEEFHAASNYTIPEKNRATSQYKRKHGSFEFSLVFSIRTCMYIWMYLHVFGEGKLAWVSQMRPSPGLARVCTSSGGSSGTKLVLSKERVRYVSWVWPRGHWIRGASLGILKIWSLACFHNITCLYSYPSNEERRIWNFKLRELWSLKYLVRLGTDSTPLWGP